MGNNESGEKGKTRDISNTRRTGKSLQRLRDLGLMHILFQDSQKNNAEVVRDFQDYLVRFPHSTAVSNAQPEVLTLYDASDLSELLSNPSNLQSGSSSDVIAAQTSGSKQTMDRDTGSIGAASSTSVESFPYENVGLATKPYDDHNLTSTQRSESLVDTDKVLENKPIKNEINKQLDYRAEKLKIENMKNNLQNILMEIRKLPKSDLGMEQEKIWCIIEFNDKYDVNNNDNTVDMKNKVANIINDAKDNISFLEEEGDKNYADKDKINKLLEIQKTKLDECEAQQIRLREWSEKTYEHAKNLWEQVKFFKQRRLEFRVIIADLKVCLQEISEELAERSQKKSQIIETNSFGEENVENIQASPAKFLGILAEDVTTILEKAGRNQEKINEMIKYNQEGLKQAREKLNLDDHPFFYKAQRRSYMPDPGLILLKGEGEEACGVRCVEMLLADRNTTFLEPEMRKKVIEIFRRMHKGEDIANGVKNTCYGEILSELNHPTKYVSLENMTPDQLWDAIGLQNEDGKDIPVIVGIYRAGMAHACLIDQKSIQGIGGERFISIRDPYLGAGYEVSWDDFLEVWQDLGRATIPAG